MDGLYESDVPVDVFFVVDEEEVVVVVVVEEEDEDEEGDEEKENEEEEEEEEAGAGGGVGGAMAFWISDLRGSLDGFTSKSSKRASLLLGVRFVVVMSSSSHSSSESYVYCSSLKRAVSLESGTGDGPQISSVTSTSSSWSGS